MTAQRRARATALLVSAAVLVGCGTATDTSARTAEQTPTPAAASPEATATSVSTAAPTPSAVSTAAEVRVLDVVFADGDVSGVDPRVPVTLGEKLLIRVTSDVADEVHVHGYDLYGEVPAGGSVEIPLTATIPGGFEVELERLGKTLFQLRVA